MSASIVRVGHVLQSRPSASSVPNLGPERYQIFTPEPLAQYAANWLLESSIQMSNILDAGAGYGALTQAAIDLFAREADCRPTFHLIENDETLFDDLLSSAATWPYSVNVHKIDFIDHYLHRASSPRYSHIIMNPPYERLFRASAADRQLRAHGIRVPNLYAGFLWMASELLLPDGELIAIVPRSFLSGASFKQVRQALFGRLHLVRIHAFGSRRMVFHRDRVLQEIVVVKFSSLNGDRSDQVYVSTSEDLTDLATSVPVSRPYCDIVDTASGSYNVRVPIDSDSFDQQRLPALQNLDISTGSVVDFRTPEVINQDACDAVVLVDSTYAGLTRKPASLATRFLVRTPRTERHIFPPGNYIVVKRVSPKEQSQRLRAAIVKESDPAIRGGVAFENHVNVIHLNRRGLPMKRAFRILEYLTSEEANVQFAALSGTTQVNVSDLRSLRRTVDAEPL